MKFRAVILLVLACLHCSHASAPKLHALAREFFAWRAVTQPATFDDIMRVERPDGWVPDWSREALHDNKAQRLRFQNRLEDLDRTGWTVADSVDYLLLRSAISRVDYELNVVRSAQRDPGFYIQQTLGAVYELILQPPPFREQRARNIVLRLESIPRTLEHSRANLTDAVAPFAEVALESLADIQLQLEAFAKNLSPLLPQAHKKRFASAVTRASEALVRYRGWIKQTMPVMQGSFVIGGEAYDRFLKQIALMPYTGDELLRMGKLELERSVAFEQYEILRNKNIPQPELFPDVVTQIEAEQRDEEMIRTFLAEKEILDVPSWMGHYRNLKMPEYIVPLSWLGVVDDLTSPSRLGQDAISYIPEPSAQLPFFRKASAQDPRPIIVHEGVPGHFFQLALSWANSDTIRRHFFDSAPIEGIGFYAEEMLLQHGLFDDRPKTREIIYRFMRLRALRVEVDVKLARGEFTIDGAGRYLAHTIPMDEATARQEAAFFAATPGQAISYQIGKMQIIQFIADAKLQRKEAFSLRTLHNFIWQNGNVPIALQRWEYLGLRDEIDELLFRLMISD